MYVGRRTNHPVVLLVDDEPNVLNSIQRSLRNERCEVITAGSCEEALGWFEELPVDVLITDQRMPGRSGLDLLREVHERYPRTASVILTGYRSSSVVREGLESGVDTFLFKPWDDGELVGTVRRLLQQ